MKRLILITVLLFCTLSFFANEKTENLPEIENAVPDFSIENDYKKIRKQERQERRNARNKRRALRRTPEYKIIRGHATRFLGFTSLALSVPYTVASVGYAYHVIPKWWEKICFDVETPNMSTILLPFTFFFGLFPVFISQVFLVSGIIFSIIGDDVCQNGEIKDKERFINLSNKHLKLYKRIAISFGVVGGCFVPMFISGIILFTGTHLGVIEENLRKSDSSTYSIRVLGGALSIFGGLVSSTGLSFMFGALGARAWLKGEMNRFSVDIGLTSGNKGELSCGRSHRQQATPNGAAIALCVKF